MKCPRCSRELAHQQALAGHLRWCKAQSPAVSATPQAELALPAVVAMADVPGPPAGAAAAVVQTLPRMPLPDAAQAQGPVAVHLADWAPEPAWNPPPRPGAPVQPAADGAAAEPAAPAPDAAPAAPGAAAASATAEAPTAATEGGSGVDSSEVVELISATVEAACPWKGGPLTEREERTLTRLITFEPSEPTMLVTAVAVILGRRVWKHPDVQPVKKAFFSAVLQRLKKAFIKPKPTDPPAGVDAAEWAAFVLRQNPHLVPEGVDPKLWAAWQAQQVAVRNTGRVVVDVTPAAQAAQPPQPSAAERVRQNQEALDAQNRARMAALGGGE